MYNHFSKHRIMKKQTLGILLLILSLVCSATAQKTDNKEEERVQLARDRYAEGLEKIANVKAFEKDDIPDINYTTVVRKENWGGSGMTVDKMEFYFNALEDDYESRPHGYNLLMIRRNYNVGSVEFVEEYVYDEEGNPLFWFTRYGYYEGKNYSYKVELRGYYDTNGTLIRSICKKAGENEELKTCSINDRVNEYDEETLEAPFNRASMNFTKFKAVFKNLYEVDYSY